MANPRLGEIPFDVLLRVVKDLDVRNVLALSESNRLLHAYSNEHSVWQSLGRDAVREGRALPSKGLKDLEELSADELKASVIGATKLDGIWSSEKAAPSSVQNIGLNVCLEAKAEYQVVPITDDCVALRVAKSNTELVLVNLQTSEIRAVQARYLCRNSLQFADSLDRKTQTYYALTGNTLVRETGLWTTAITVRRVNLANMISDGLSTVSNEALSDEPCVWKLHPSIAIDSLHILNEAEHSFCAVLRNVMRREGTLGLSFCPDWTKESVICINTGIPYNLTKPEKYTCVWDSVTNRLIIFVVPKDPLVASGSETEAVKCHAYPKAFLLSQSEGIPVEEWPLVAPPEVVKVRETAKRASDEEHEEGQAQDQDQDQDPELEPAAPTEAQGRRSKWIWENARASSGRVFSGVRSPFQHSSFDIKVSRGPQAGSGTDRDTLVYSFFRLHEPEPSTLATEGEESETGAAVLERLDAPIISEPCGSFNLHATDFGCVAWIGSDGDHRAPHLRLARFSWGRAHDEASPAVKTCTVATPQLIDLSRIRALGVDTINGRIMLAKHDESGAAELIVLSFL